MKTLGTDVNTSSNLELFHFTQGLDVDHRLYKQEIAVQKAWARALVGCSVLTKEETTQLENTLDKAQTLIEAEDFHWQVEDEDIHMNLERFLTSELGELGKKIHIGRSRNDLIATTLRLFVQAELKQMEQFTEQLISAIYEQSSKWMENIIPGMTHLQFGQPIRFGHTFAAHGFALKRDLLRLKAAQEQCLLYMPLGAAAFAGTHLQMDLTNLAKDLNFQRPLDNSYDAVSDRDYILESLNTYAIMAMHISRFCEDVMYWSSSAVQVLKLPYDWSTGSSIMPNKRNPDVPELSRGKMARVISAANEGLILTRSVTPSYGSDLHELKRTFLTANDELRRCLIILKPFTLGLEVHSKNVEQLLKKGHILATDIANELTKEKPFRQAYQDVAKAVAQANQEDLQVEEIYKQRGEFSQLNPTSSVEARRNIGGTSLNSAKQSLEALKKK